MKRSLLRSPGEAEGAYGRAKRPWRIQSTGAQLGSLNSPAYMVIWASGVGVLAHQRDLRRHHAPLGEGWLGCCGALPGPGGARFGHRQARRLYEEADDRAWLGVGMQADVLNAVLVSGLVPGQEAGDARRKGGTLWVRCQANVNEVHKLTFTG